MSRFPVALSVIAVVMIGAGCGQHSTESEDPADAAYSQFRDAYLDAERREDQAALVEEFITEWPDHRNTGYFAADIVTYYSDHLGDGERAYQIVSGVLQGATDPEVRFWLGTTLAPVAADLGRDLDLTGLIADLEASTELGFDHTEQILSAAAALADWDLLDRWSDEALERSTPEAFRADYPNRDFDDEDVQRRADRRRAIALSSNGWAAYNLGRTDDAFGAFENASRLAEKNYLGLSGTPLERYWAQALLDSGDAARAIAVISREAVFGDHARAEPVLREAWTTANDSGEGFDDFLDTARLELAPAIDDFTLTDYQGNTVSLNGVRGDKVTLLAFWFPT
jgi:hypothetical protein